MTEKEMFIRQYMDYVDSSDFIPNNYCTVPYLLSRDDLEVHKDRAGRKGLRIKGTDYFFLPPFSEKNGKVEFDNTIALVNFPEQEKKTRRGFRYDTEYYYFTSNSIRIIYTDRDTRFNAKKEHTSISVPYSNHEYDSLLEEFYTYMTTISHQRSYIDPNFRNFLFNDYGQHRFVLFYKGEVDAVMLWSENSSFINVHNIYGRATSKNLYETKEYRKNNFFYAARVIAFDFMRHFPIGTYMNMGSPGYNKYLKKVLEASRPCHIIEVKSFKPREQFRVFHNNKRYLVGKTVEEELKWIGSRKTMPNKMLLNHLYARNVNYNKLAKPVARHIKYVKRRKMRRIRSNNRFIAKLKAELQNKT